MSVRKGAVGKVRKQLTKAGAVEVTIKLARPVTAQNSAYS